jgi:hypothetical protein
MAICHRHGLGLLSAQRPLTAAGDTVFTDAVIHLERAFGICIEMDELWWGMTVPQLVALVEAKTSDVHRKALLPANDHFPAEPAPFLRRTPIVGLKPAAHAVRERRIAARSNWREVWAVLKRLFQVAALVGSTAGVVAFFVLGGGA